MKKRYFSFLRKVSLPEDKTGKNRSILFYFSGLSALLVFVYFFRFGDGLFFVQDQKVLFIYSAEYLRSFACKPGGMLEYAGIFLTQGYRSVLYGSLLLTSLFLLFSASFFRAAIRLSGTNNVQPFTVLVPSFLLLLILVREDQFLYQPLGYWLTLVCFYAAIKSAGKGLYGVIPVCFPVLFYLTGSFSFLFVLMIAAFSILFLKGRQRFLCPFILVATGVCTFFIFREIIFLQPTKSLLGYPLSYSKFPEILLTGFMVVFPVILKAGMNRKQKCKSSDGLTVVTLVLLMAFTVLYLGIQYNPERRKELILENLFVGQKWDEVIRYHQKYRSENAAGQYFFNLALLEKDELCERMFTSRQDFHGKSLSLSRTRENLNKAFHFYYAIGLINEAYHLACESMVINGYQAGNLKMLIKTDLINGNHANAERHIGILEKTLFYRGWASQYEKMLFKPGEVLSDAELGRKAMLRPRFDFFVTPDDRDNLDLMLIANPDNKKVFECRMAWLLLEKDYKTVVYHVKRMKDMGYQRIPSHIEEAVMIFENKKYDMPYLGGFRIGEDNRYPSFLSDLRKAGAEDRQTIEKEMRPRWKDTYWYYHEFH